MFLRIVLLAVAVGAYPGGYLIDNEFEVTSGCQQLNANIGYNADHPYYGMGQFRNVEIENGTTRMRMGVLGDRNAYIRLAPTSRPYSSTLMHEIVISHTINCETYLQRYVRTAPNSFYSHEWFKKINTMDWMSSYAPLMFTVEITKAGRVTVTRDYHSVPFIDETDSTVSTDYIGFVNWATNERVIFFVDCPLKE
uniref:Putative farnesoic acid 0-methyl transferase n=1 Tax=Culex tarsalis TaxID=7177 RepID=A0A1Q3EWJ7_CULTA